MLKTGICSAYISIYFRRMTVYSLFIDSWCIYSLIFDIRCVKSAQIRSFSWSVFFCIQSEYRKILIRKSSIFRHFSRSEHFMEFIPAHRNPPPFCRIYFSKSPQTTTFCRIYFCELGPDFQTSIEGKLMLQN